MGAYTAEYLNKQREHWKNTLGKWQVCDGSTWRDAVVNDINVELDQIVAYVYANSTGVAGRVTGIRCYDVDGRLALSWNMSIERSKSQNVLAKVVLPIREV